MSFWFFVARSLSLTSTAQISYLRALAPNWQRLHIVREGDVLELRFWAAMIEDKPRGGAQLSYYEFLQSLQKEVAKATANP
jgi:hypothetical protein